MRLIKQDAFRKIHRRYKWVYILNFNKESSNYAKLINGNFYEVIQLNI